MLVKYVCVVAQERQRSVCLTAWTGLSVCRPRFHHLPRVWRGGGSVGRLGGGWGGMGRNGGGEERTQKVTLNLPAD